MDSLIKSIKNDDVCNFEKLIHLLDKLDLSDLPDIFCNNPNFIAYAAFYGATKCLLFLLKQGMKTENVDDESRSAIHFACAGGNLKMVQMIIEDFNQLNYVDAPLVSSLGGGSFSGCSSFGNLTFPSLSLIRRRINSSKLFERT